jgi:hypothetical protein
MMRAVKKSGRTAATLDGSQIADAECTRAAGPSWTGTPSRCGMPSAARRAASPTNALLGVAYLVPAAGMAAGRNPRTRAVGALGYAAGVASRAMVARRTGESLPDALAHPVSIAAFCSLNLVSWWRQLRGTNRWKGRSVSIARPSSAAR